MKIAGNNPKIRTAAVLLPTLDEAVEQWRVARRVFLRRPGRESFDAFHNATTTLYVSFVGDNAEERWAVKAFEAFRRALVAAETPKEPRTPQWLSLLPR